MPDKDGLGRSDLLQGTLDLMVLQTLAGMGPLHGYGILLRIAQISGQALLIEQGAVYVFGDGGLKKYS